VLALGLQGCLLVGPDYVEPDPEMPDRWHEELSRGLAEGRPDLRLWWTVLDDPILDSLIERARAGNLELLRSVYRIEEARAVRGIAGSERYPIAVGDGTAERTRTSEAVTSSLPPGQSRVDTFYSVGGSAFWEFDLWGRIRRSVESADASLQASIEDYRDIQVSLYSEVALSYVNVRTIQQRIRFAEGNVGTQLGSLRLTQDRRRAGIGSDLDVSQAELNLASTEAFIPSLRIELAREIHALGVLLGEHPSALYPELAPERPIPAAPEQVLVDLPANLLRQRPDIRRSERLLASQNAQIGVAQAELYPSFSLGGTLAIEAFSAGDMFTSGSDSYGFGPAFRWTIFDGGRIRSQIRVEDARTQQALAAYEESVLRALEEVETSMVSFAQEQEREDALARSVSAARRAVELVNTLYKTGLTDFQNVLDSERSLFEQEDDLAVSTGRVTGSLIAIYRSLGGGWSPDTATP
jgi:NodT family efflux transporter outer membrane factor (OMF) lipoprotein